MSTAWETVRVFVSSTFRDMHAERDHLVKVVFPRLRERLIQHRIGLVDIDLRWGVTREEAQNNEVLRLCLEEIDGSRPFFLGILGQWYGSVATEPRDDVLARYGWLDQHRGKSLTELEFISALSQDRDTRDRAVICFRNPSFLAELPDVIRNKIEETDPQRVAQQQRFVEWVREADIPIPPVDYACRYAGFRVHWRLLKQELEPADRDALDAHLVDGVISPVEYSQLDERLQTLTRQHGALHLTGLEDFGRQVEERLFAAIGSHIDLADRSPVDAEEDPSAAADDDHDRFLEDRLRCYVRREQIHESLDHYVEEDDSRVCLVVGSSGAGKSSALASLVARYRQRHPESLVIPHFVGASSQSSDLHLMLRRVCMALKRHFGFSWQVPDAPAALVSKFLSVLHSVPAPTLLVIDGVDQMVDINRSGQMRWLPDRLPVNVKIIVSCTSGPSGQPSLPVVEDMDCRRCEVGPLTDAERSEIIRTVPSLAAKTLDDRQVELLMANSATGNPLFLRVALEELRSFGSFEQLDAMIGQFPSGEDAVTLLFDQVLTRLELDFDPRLVRAISGWIACSRAGLAERELQSVLGTEHSHGDLFAVLRQLRPYLHEHAGLVTIYHDGLRQAIEKRYLHTPELLQTAWTQLADYFEALGHGRRRVVELPWLLDRLQAWERLSQALSNVDYFAAVHAENSLEARRYWAHVENNSHYRAVDAYGPLLENPVNFLRRVYPVADLLGDLGYLQQAEALLDCLAEHGSELGDPAIRIAAMGDRAIRLREAGRLDEAMALHQKEESLCREMNNESQLQASLGNQGIIYKDRGQYDEAMRLHRAQEEICRRRGIRDGLANSLGNQGNVHFCVGNLQEAMELFRAQEKLCREDGDAAGAARAVCSQAMVLDREMVLRRSMQMSPFTPDQLAVLDEALGLLDQVEAVYRDIHDLMGLRTCLHNQATTRAARRDFAEAFKKLAELEQLIDSLPECQHVLDCYKACQQEMNLCKQEGGSVPSQDELFEWLQMEQRLAVRVGDFDALHTSLMGQAIIQRTRGNLNEALRLHEQEEQALRRLGDEYFLKMCLDNQEQIIRELGDDAKLERLLMKRQMMP
jgi:tetratricopeptide (TPR) repeat protein